MSGMGRSAEELQKIWLASLAHERRASPNTLRAYGDDVSRFIGFQRGHLGGAVTERALAGLKAADIRAFIAARRSEGLGAGGVQRALAGNPQFLSLSRQGRHSGKRQCAGGENAPHQAPPAAPAQRERSASARSRTRANMMSTGWGRAMPRC